MGSTGKLIEPMRYEESHDSSHEHWIKMEEVVQTAVEELGYTNKTEGSDLQTKHVFVSLPTGSSKAFTTSTTVIVDIIYSHSQKNCYPSALSLPLI